MREKRFNSQRKILTKNAISYDDDAIFRDNNKIITVYDERTKEKNHCRWITQGSDPYPRL